MTHLRARHSIEALDLAGNIVSAYVANNALTASELPELIGIIHASLSGLANDAAAAAPIKGNDKATPAQIRKSITPDALISFIDGKAYKTLKRHLSGNGLNPRSYRERYGLPANYPMVAASYAEERSRIAKAIGLGKPLKAEAASLAAGESRAPTDHMNRRGRRRSTDL